MLAIEHQQLIDVIDELLSLVHVDMPDEFYELPMDERKRQLRDVFPAWFSSLPDGTKTRIGELVGIVMKHRMENIEGEFIAGISQQIRDIHAAELATNIKFTAPQLDKLLDRDDHERSPTTVKEKYF